MLRPKIPYLDSLGYIFEKFVVIFEISPLKFDTKFMQK